MSFDPRNCMPRGQFPRPTVTYVTNRADGRITPLHTHWAKLDANGNGTTDIQAGHYHRILGKRIMPSPVDSHEHILTALPGGVG